MNLAELIAGVKTVVNRQDLTAQVDLAVKQSTLKLHHTDYYYRDLFETGLMFGSAAFIQQADIKSLIPRWRANKYLRKSDVNGALGDFFEIIVPEHVLDSYNVQREDVYYVGGDILQVKSSTSFQYALYGCYRHPDITDLGYSSFIAVDFPYAIITDAAASVFKRIGKDSESAELRMEVWGDPTKKRRGMVDDIRDSNVSAQGY
jgi:hypothetical protein